MRKIIYTLSIITLCFMGTPALAACTDITQDLGTGSTDTNASGNVTRLQNFLKEVGFLSATPNGVFGPATLTAVKKYQTSQSLSSTGFVGPLTRSTIKAKSCAQITAPTSPAVVSNTKTIIRPREGAVITMGKPQIIRWQTELKSNYSIILENAEGVSQGYIAASRLGGTEFEWTAGEVFSTESQMDTTVAPGTYKIRIRNTYSGTSVDDPQSGLFTLISEPLIVQHIYPVSVKSTEDTTVMLYGSGLKDKTSVYIDGPYNMRTNRLYASPDKKVFVFTVSKGLSVGEHKIWAYNGTDSVDTGLTINVQ